MAMAFQTMFMINHPIVIIHGLISAVALASAKEFDIGRRAMNASS